MRARKGEIENASIPVEMAPAFAASTWHAAARARLWQLLLLAIVAGMLLPAWVGRYAPLWDYANHLQEAQVAAHYTEPALDYSRFYLVRSNWIAKSNALSTLMLIGLGKYLPMQAAGKIILSGYILLFAAGYWLLLRRGGMWPMALLAPVLAYNFPFLGGFLNFSYSIAIGLFAWLFYLRWQEEHRLADLFLLGGSLALVYLSHLASWAFWLAAIAAHSAAAGPITRRHAALLAAMWSGLPFLAVSRPALAAAAGLIAPITWVAATAARRLRLRAPAIALVGAAGVASAAVLLQIFSSQRQQWFPELHFDKIMKLTMPLHLFTLPHQYHPRSPGLIAYNLLLLALLAGIVAMLTWLGWRALENRRAPWLAAVGVLAGIYILAPSITDDLTFIEPRILLIAVIIFLTSVRFNTTARGWKALATLVAVTGIAHILALSIYAWSYEQRSRQWEQQLEALRPAKAVLVLQRKPSDVSPPEPWFDSFNLAYSGVNFTNIYNLNYGGYNSRTFFNGPVRPKREIYIPIEFLAGDEDNLRLLQECKRIRTLYDGVIFWGQPHPKQQRTLEQCLGAGESFPDMVIWKIP